LAAVNAAEPPLSVTVPNTVAPSRNCTVPVAAAGATDAVRFTFCPYTIDPLLAETAVVVGALFTVCVNATEVTPLQLASPAYTTVMEWLPADSPAVLSDALPPLTVAVPITVAPSRNCTLPVAVAGESVAVKTTACPLAAGFTEEPSPTVVAAFATVTVAAADVLPA
jgi:hypothetical protein